MPDYLKVIIASAITYVYLFIIAKLLGKKQIAQLSFIDYIVGITIGSIAAEMSTETTEPIYQYIIAMTLFFLFDLLITILSRKSAGLKKLLNGKPLILIDEGKFDYENLKKSKISVDEVSGMARDKGYFDINDIAFAIFETSGKLSIMPKSHNKPVVAKDMGITPEKPQLTQYLVVDGKVSNDSLKQSGRDKDWLFKELKIKDESELNNILVASYDETRKNFNVHYKNTNA
ncbi:MAG TPA: DUF421 domain-containing protein [Clostridia bacterium]|nr:DUF421 domain-containing protein [Clostridia bacterium]